MVHDGVKSLQRPENVCLGGQCVKLGPKTVIYNYRFMYYHISKKIFKIDSYQIIFLLGSLY